MQLMNHFHFSPLENTLTSIPIQKLTISWSGIDFIRELVWKVDSSSDKHRQHVPFPSSRPVSTMFCRNVAQFWLKFNEFTDILWYLYGILHYSIKHNSFIKRLIFLFILLSSCQALNVNGLFCTKKTVSKMVTATSAMSDICPYQNICRFLDW